jgi:hypothetical protein
MKNKNFIALIDIIAIIFILYYTFSGWMFIYRNPLSRMEHMSVLLHPVAVMTFKKMDKYQITPKSLTDLYNNKVGPDRF